MTYEVEVVVCEKEVFGSLTQKDSYGDDTLLEVRDWIDALLAKVPAEYSAEVKINVNSVGGYEGEHHTEIKVYYRRPATAKETAEREAAEQSRRKRIEADELRTLAALKKKYGA